METSHPHHREFSRSPSAMETEVIVEGYPVIVSRTDDVSLNGISVSCQETLELGTRCQVRIHMTGRGSNPVIVAEAHVARSEPGHLALEIDTLDPESFSHLRTHVLLNSPDPDQTEGEFLSHHGLRPNHG